jgi:hypothetical protein
MGDRVTKEPGFVRFVAKHVRRDRRQETGDGRWETTESLRALRFKKKR